MYKATPITKRAGSPLQNDLVDNDARNREKGKKDPSIDIITKSTKKGEEGTPDEIVKTAKPYVGAANDACSAEYIAKNGNSACEKYKALSDEKKDAANYDTTVVKGTDAKPDETNYQATELFRQDFGTNVGDIEQREMNRVTKKAEKDVRRGKIKSARSKAKGYTVNEDGEAVETEAGKLKGKAKRDFMKKARQKAKAEERSAETRSFKTRAANAAEGQASGQGLNTRFRSKDVDESQADFTRKQQGNMIAQGKEQEKLAKDKGTPMRAPLKKNYFKKY